MSWKKVSLSKGKVTTAIKESATKKVQEKKIVPRNKKDNGKSWRGFHMMKDYGLNEAHKAKDSLTWQVGFSGSHGDTMDRAGAEETFFSAVQDNSTLVPIIKKANITWEKGEGLGGKSWVFTISGEGVDQLKKYMDDHGFISERYIHKAKVNEATQTGIAQLYYVPTIENIDVRDIEAVLNNVANVKVVRVTKFGTPENPSPRSSTQLVIKAPNDGEGRFQLELAQKRLERFRGFKKVEEFPVYDRTDESNDEDEISPDDFIITTRGNKYVVGSEDYGHIGDFTDWDDAVKAFKDWCKDNKHYPTLWEISDHGNIIGAVTEASNAEMKKTVEDELQAWFTRWFDEGDYYEFNNDGGIEIYDEHDEAIDHYSLEELYRRLKDDLNESSKAWVGSGSVKFPIEVRMIRPTGFDLIVGNDTYDIEYNYNKAEVTGIVDKFGTRLKPKDSSIWQTYSKYLDIYPGGDGKPKVDIYEANRTADPTKKEMVDLLKSRAKDIVNFLNELIELAGQVANESKVDEGSNTNMFGEPILKLDVSFKDLKSYVEDNGIYGYAKDIYDLLRNDPSDDHMNDISEFTRDNPRFKLKDTVYSRLYAWLEWNGIVGYAEDFLDYAGFASHLDPPKIVWGDEG